MYIRIVTYYFLLLLLMLSTVTAQESKETFDIKLEERKFNQSDIQLPPGYNIEVFVKGLNYPSDITFSDYGDIYISEAGDHTYGTTPGKSPDPGIIQITKDGSKRVLYSKVVPLETIKKAKVGDDLPEGIIPPILGVTWHEGKLYITHRTRVSTLNPQTGEFKTIIDKLPSWGFFHAGKVIFDKDGKMVFCLSTQGNAGPVDEHWMKVINIFNKHDAHEVPGEDVTLTGKNFAVPVEEAGTPDVADKKMTGVFVPLGTETKPGQVIEGEEICNGAFFRANSDGSGLERIAWGFRSNFGYRFSKDGRLITTQNSGNPIPPREIHDDWEPIYEVIEGEWYGWPDFYSSEPVTNERFGTHAMKHEFVLTDETHKKLLKGKEKPLPPLAKLGPHTSAEGMVFGKAEFGIPENEILVAEFGTIVPHTLEKLPGFKVSRVNLDNGGSTDFAVNKSKMPASATKGGGLERPIQIEWGNDGNLYVVDFGSIGISEKGMSAVPHSGAVWKISREKNAKPLETIKDRKENKEGKKH